jgi:hypothetical protein
MVHHHTINIDHETKPILENRVLNDHSQDVDDKYQLTNYSTLISLILVIYILTNTNTAFVGINRRFIVFTPIFYQSNFVNSSPLSKK